jgi:hypothetical protein
MADAESNPADGTQKWTMWAGDYGDHLQHLGIHRHYPEAFGDEPVRVAVRRDEQGPYWAWLHHGDTAPAHVYLREHQFWACFTYEPSDKDGSVIRCSVAREVT